MDNNPKDPRQRIHYRTTDHFLPKNFEQFKTAVEENERKSLTDIQLQVSGYGVFNQRQILGNFFNYVEQVVRTSVNQKLIIKSFKINIGGFTFKKQEKQYFAKFVNTIKEIGQFLKVFHIHTANLKQLQLKDFEKLLKLSIDFADSNFEEFSLQCSNWVFANGQPKLTELKDTLTHFVAEGSMSLKNKRFRIQMSGWFYEERQALLFLNPGNVENIQEKQLNEDIQTFQNDMQSFLQQLLNGMSEIQEMQLDLRNWNDILRMKDLKKKLDNVSKQDRKEVSIMSKRKFGNQNPKEDDEKELKITIAV